ncbi:MAG: GGDEF domain-containing protein [Sedimenticola selenatireducens]|uniref:diguanylate cyclase n=2 Tax=Sedimenticola selenatireducens TaxID=191960 RepID=A0A558DXA5_9GAMM|nr:GGDEF domain-containing protein [Sedimenticola selenatireducens]TVT65647.1 MAG: GGDEF domain-containing protein [Sedimenticola selenatireducens]
MWCMIGQPKEKPYMDHQEIIERENQAMRATYAQQLRFRRYLMAVTSYLIGAFMVGLLVWLGYLTMEYYLYFIGLMVLINALFFVLFKTGLNLRFSDPSLTSLQIVASTILTVQISYLVTDGRGILLLLYLTSHLFGVFRLSFRQFLLLDAFSIAAYGLMLQLLIQNRPETIDINLEILYWAALIIVLPSFALMGAYLNRLRERLNERNTHLNKALKKIQELAVTDELTGLHNRRSIMSELSKEWERTERSGNHFCIALMDLDLFKEINDTYGHHAGDTVLKRFASLVSKELRSPDSIGRYGGEEFLLIMPNTRIIEAKTVTERIREKVAGYTHDDIDQGLTIHVSIGIAEYQNQSTQELLKQADTALYESKNNGRNRVSIHTTHLFD